MIGNKNAITYKEVFPLIKNNEMWLGKTPMSVDLLFEVPDITLITKGKKLGSGYRIIDGKILARSQSVWFTNIDHGRRHQPLSLMTMADNLRYSRHKELKGKAAYDRYDNYDAIEVPFTDAIPSDYYGVMGVPISFLDKYCPEQFEILGITKTWFGGAIKTYPKQIQIDKNGKRSIVTKLNDGAVIKLPIPPEDETYYEVDSECFVQVYARVLIQSLVNQLITPPYRNRLIEDLLKMIMVKGCDKYDRPYVIGRRMYARLLVIRKP